MRRDSCIEVYTDKKGTISMKKKITLAIALCAALCSFAGCNSGTPAATTGSSAAESAAPASETPAATETNETAAASAEQTPAPAENTDPDVIYEADGVKIKSTGFRNCAEYDDGPMLGLEITNNTGKALTIYSRGTSLNGWMVNADLITIKEDGYLNVGGNFEVPAENDTNTYGIYIGNFILDELGMSEIVDLNLSLEVIVGEDWENAVTTDMVTITNPDASGEIPSFDESGDVAYDKDGIKIVLRGANYDTSYWGPTVYLYAHNGTDKNITIRIPKSSLNGEEHTAYGDMDIAPGMRMKEEVMFENAASVAPLGKVTMTFEIYENSGTGEPKLLDTSGEFTAEYEPIEIKTEAQTAEEAEAARGWWKREGTFKDADNNTLTLTFMSTAENWSTNNWYANGSFGANYYWGGNVQIGDDGLSGTADTSLLNDDGTFSEGNPIDVKIAEDGADGVKLTLGTGEEYHFTPAAEE